MAGELERLLSLSDYAAARSHVFPSATSMTWYVRQHRRELVEAGALLMITGRWFADPDKFDAFVIEEGARAAGRRQSDLP